MVLHYYDKSLQIYFFCVKHQAKNDFLKDVESTVVRLFNVVFVSESYPAQWSEGLITPIHKKDNLEDVNN